MKRILAILFFIAISSFIHAQKLQGTVKGHLQEASSATPLPDATVSVMSAHDSSLISFTLTSGSGYFEIKNLDSGTYYLMISYQGLETLKKSFTITPGSPVADLQVVKMDKSYKTLSEVVVTDVVPIRVKGDTIAYNADAFKTRPNATVEDLLKKLPGMQVERDGTVKAQGENVQKVYVDGKEFFGSDPKLATKNLTADMVEQVEVYDDMSEQAKFNQIDDGSRSKAINLKLKKEKKKGVFGKAHAGYGTEDRYDAGITANYFKGATQLSLISKANNINNIGFSVTDMLGMFGSGGFGNFGGRGGGGGGGMTVIRGISGNSGGFNPGAGTSGITKTASAGLNYRDTWSPKFDANGSYFYNHALAENVRKSDRRTFYGDSTLKALSESWSMNENNNHRINFRIQFSIDSLNSIIYSPSVSFQNSETYRLDSTLQYAEKGSTSYLLNDIKNQNTSIGTGVNWTNNLIWRRKLNKIGRTFSLSFANTFSRSERDNYLLSNGSFYNSLGNKVDENDINRQTLQNNTTDNYSITASYTEPIARDKIWEFNYNHTDNKNGSERLAYDYNTLTGKYDVANNQLTNLFENSVLSNRFGTNFRVIRKKYNFQLGAGVQSTILQSINRSKGTNQREKYLNLFPTANFNYQFARSRSLRFNYSGRTSQPSITQLQNVLDESNAPIYRNGNPFLRQEFSNNLSLSYNFFDMVKFRNVFALIGFSNTYDKIVDNIRTRNFPAEYRDRQKPGAQYITPDNMDGVFTVTGAFNIGFPIKMMKGGNFNTNTRISYGQNGNITDGVQNYTKNLTIGEDLRLNYNYKDKLDLGIAASVNYTAATYTIRRDLDNHYFTHVYSADISYLFKKGLILSTDFDYTLNPDQGAGIDRDFALWNASLAKELFKSRRGELKLSVYDIMNQNQSFNRYIGENYTEDVQNTVLDRFFLLTFTYKLNRMGGKNMMPGMLERRAGNIRVN